MLKGHFAAGNRACEVGVGGRGDARSRPRPSPPPAGRSPIPGWVCKGRCCGASPRGGRRRCSGVGVGVLCMRKGLGVGGKGALPTHRGAVGWWCPHPGLGGIVCGVGVCRSTASRAGHWEESATSKWMDGGRGVGGRGEPGRASPPASRGVSLAAGPRWP